MRYSMLGLMVVLIAGAGSAQAAASPHNPPALKPANLLKKLKTEYDGRKACVGIGFNSFPIKVDLQKGRINGVRSASFFDHLVDDLKVLLRVGLLKHVNSSNQSENAAAGQSSSDHSSLFSQSKPVKLALTSAGRSALDQQKNSLGHTYNRFCYGHYQVEKVLNYSTPAADKNGRIVTRVKFSQSIHDVAPWASKFAKLDRGDQAKQVKRVLKTQTDPKIRHTYFIATANGWILESNF